MKSLLLITAILASLRPHVSAVELPRYKFEPGEVLVYSESSDFDYGRGAFKDTGSVQVCVTGQNPNGSWHLIFVRKTQDVRTGDIKSSNERISFGQFDLFPDGRKADQPAKIPHRDEPSVFFPLPADAGQVKDGWQVAESEAVQKVYRAKEDGKTWIIDSTEKGIFSDIYESCASATIHFDREQGLVEKIAGENAQGYGFVGHGKSLVELKSRTVQEKDLVAKLVADVGAVEAAEAVTTAQMESVEAGATTGDKATVTAKQALESALLQVGNTELRDKIKSDIERLASRFQYAQQEGLNKDTVLNKPAATWKTTDLDGKEHALEDFRGKVLVLDFWYRGCGWCVTAMPQIKALADEFRDQPVAIVGMNTDQEDKDARFVMDKLQLNYPTFHGTGIPEKYGVRGFPTLIVIDQKGVVRVRHVGYSKTLREEISQKISGLLSENQ
jgi:thiol-disulfide isomerase/thioredoxin